MIRQNNFRINLVTGPPASGKTTYVKSQMIPGDLVIDLDAIAAAISYSPLHEDDPKNIKFAWRLMDAALNELVLGTSESNHRAWVVGCFRADRRDAIIRYLRPERIIVLATPLVTCLSRLRMEASSRPKKNLYAAVYAWWKEWEGIPNAEIITADTLERTDVVV